VVYSAPVYAPPVICAPAPSVYLGFGRAWCGPYRAGWGGHGSWAYHRGWHR
jgi:hypothetical protein